MSKYIIEVHRHYTYEIEIEADDEMAAIEGARDYEIEDMEPYEKDAWFTFDVIGYPDEK